MPLQDMFSGDRTGGLEDPFGHVRNLAQHVGDPTPEEVRKGPRRKLEKQPPSKGSLFAFPVI
jgi:PhnB protein